MCTLQAGLITAGLIGTGIQAVGQFNQGRNEAAESRFREQIASNNAIIANQNAQISLEKGRADVRDKRRETSQRIGAQRAQLAAAGFDVSQGSSIDILGDTAALGELDVLRIESDSANRARNFRVQAGGFETDASLNAFAAKNQKKAGTIRAGATLITGASRFGSSVIDKGGFRKVFRRKP